MANRKKRMILFSLVVLTAIFISACERSFSNVPVETPIADGTSLFVSPFPTSDNPMAMVEELSTGTALAETAAALTAGTPLAPQQPALRSRPIAMPRTASRELSRQQLTAAPVGGNVDTHASCSPPQPP